MIRDCEQPYTAAQLADFEQYFRNLPTYKKGPSGGSIKTSDFVALLNKMDYHRSPEEIQVYINYQEQKANGILTLEECMESLSNLHDSSATFKAQALRFDLDGDGFISASEFELMLPPLAVHDPRFKGVSYADFLREADTNKDGKISVEECATWVKNRSAKAKIPCNVPAEAYTPAQLEKCKHDFQKLPTYKKGPGGGSIKSMDIPLLCKGIDFHRTPDEYQVFVNYVDQKNNGILTCEEALKFFAIAHDPAAIAKSEALKFDVNGDGFISADEFQLLLSALAVHDSRLLGRTYEDFVREADTNKDGKISVEECANWVASLTKKK